MTRDGASKVHLFVSFVVAIVALAMVINNTFEIRVAGILLLLADIIQFGMFYEKL